MKKQVKKKILFNIPSDNNNIYMQQVIGHWNNDSGCASKIKAKRDKK